MRSSETPELLITGIGATTSIGQGKDAFISGLLKGKHAFSVMQRPGRQKDSNFLGAELPSLTWPDTIAPRTLRSASFSASVALLTLAEAWHEAQLNEIDPTRVGLIIGGSNVQQREIAATYELLAAQPYFVKPSYAITFLDTDLCGICTQQFGIRGFAYTIGGASASGQLAVIKAAQAIASGEVDVCIALGALMDLSFWECYGFQSLGAMGSVRFADSPASACRPFDRDRDGFIYGESCGAVVIERGDHAAKRSVDPYALIRGWGQCVDGNRNPNPSMSGEIWAIKQALSHAGLRPADIDYINPHGSGSVVGDEIELQAIRECGLAHAAINTTKSLVGHGLTSAGIIEIIATVLQMKASMLHPSRNLDNPIDSSFQWVGERAVPHLIEQALSLSIGFSGINTALCLENVRAR